ncbi:uncharacterized protein V1510DRAFT_400495 [Dipodascopsis tothii]|uniref:uncharacterized protein n=1 Tax=Dipodascopsis tothii TaxID=44089 RepID=UPI0034CF525D
MAAALEDAATRLLKLCVGYRGGFSRVPGLDARATAGAATAGHAEAADTAAAVTEAFGDASAAALNVAAGPRRGPGRPAAAQKQPKTRSVRLTDAFAAQLSDKEAYALALQRELWEQEQLLAQREVEVSQTDVEHRLRHLSEDELRAQIEAERERLRAHTQVVETATASLALLKVVYNDGPMSDRDRSLRELAAVRDSEATRLLGLLERADVLKTELRQQQDANIEQHKINRDLVERIVRVQERRRAAQAGQLEDDDRQAVKELSRQVEDTQAKLAMIKAVLMGMVLSSGIDWASDAELQETVLECSDDRYAMREQVQDEQDEDDAFWEEAVAAH